MDYANPPRPFHEGELLIQRRRGVHNEAAEVNEMGMKMEVDSLLFCFFISDQNRFFFFSHIANSLLSISLPPYPVQPFLSPFSAALFRSCRFVMVGTMDSEKRIWACGAYGNPVSLSSFWQQ